MGINPPRWTAEEFEREAAQAIRHFRETRMHEPLEAYLDYVEEYRRQVETLIEETVDLTRLSNLAVELLTNPQRLTAIRYLASPAISEDDLKVLADAALTPKRLNADPDMARRVIETVLMGLDRERFPWVAESREPTEGERATAVVSTAALIATQKVQTGRRNEAKKTQEGAVADALRAAGFTEVPTRAVTNMSHLPAHGEFCAEALFGSRKADLNRAPVGRPGHAHRVQGLEFLDQLGQAPQQRCGGEGADLDSGVRHGDVRARSSPVGRFQDPQSHLRPGRWPHPVLGPRAGPDDLVHQQHPGGRAMSARITHLTLECRSNKPVRLYLYWASLEP